MATTYVNFHGGITQNTAQNFMSVLSEKITAGTDHFYILLSTQGGDIQSGMTMYNFLRAIPARITVHNIGSVEFFWPQTQTTVLPAPTQPLCFTARNFESKILPWKRSARERFSILFSRTKTALPT
jgi:hypothetical protein